MPMLSGNDGVITSDIGSDGIAIEVHPAFYGTPERRFNKLNAVGATPISNVDGRIERTIVLPSRQ